MKKVLAGQGWISSGSGNAACRVAGAKGCLVLLVLAKLQLLQAAFTCSGGPASCPDNNLQVGVLLISRVPSLQRWSSPCERLRALAVVEKENEV